MAGSESEMNISPQASDKLYLTDRENAEWEANGFGFKKNLKLKVKRMKESVKARRDISVGDYRTLLRDRQRRMELITLARPIFLDNDKLFRIGVPAHLMQDFYGDLQAGDHIYGGYTAAKEALDHLAEAVFTHNASRQDIVQKGFWAGGMTRGQLEKAEMCIDYVIWRLKPYMEDLAERFGIADSDQLHKSHLVAIREVVDKEMTVRSSVPGRGGYEWRLERSDADRMARHFPRIAHHIRAGEVA